MGKRNRIVVLLLLVSCIWGVIIFRIYSGASEATRIGVFEQVKTKEIVPVPKVFSIHAYNRDPFLSILKDTATDYIPEPVSKQQVRPTNPLLSLPEYCGTIRRGKNVTAILKLKGRYEHLRAGETTGDVRLYKITHEHIDVIVKGEHHKVYLTKGELSTAQFNEKKDASR